jgi:hypothetical protein
LSVIYEMTPSRPTPPPPADKAQQASSSMIKQSQHIKMGPRVVQFRLEKWAQRTTPFSHIKFK